MRLAQGGFIEASPTFITPDPWKLLLLQFICLCVFARRQFGLGVGIGIGYYSHASIPIPIPTATPIDANPTYPTNISSITRIDVAV